MLVSGQIMHVPMYFILVVETLANLHVDDASKPHTQKPNESRVPNPKIWRTAEAVFLDGPKGELAIRLALRLCEYPQAVGSWVLANATIARK